MKIQLLLENIGPITKAKVNLKNLSIIVGANSIGKSLISKSTYITLRGLNLDDDSFTELINAEVYKPQLYSDSENISVSLLIDSDERLNLTFNPLRIKSTLSNEIKCVTYVGGPLIVNEPLISKCEIDHDNDLKCKLINKVPITNKADLEKIAELNLLFDEVIEEHKLVYIDETNSLGLQLSNKFILSMNKAPNGIKSFLILKELLNNGYLQEDMVLILDEPEILSHASWQLIYAHIISKIIKYFKVKVMINTCSLYFIEALEMYSKSYELNTDYYLGEKLENGYTFTNQNNNLQLIYSTLLEPYEKLDDLKLYYTEGK